MEIKFHQHVAGILSARLQLHHAGMAGQNQEVRGRRPSLGSVHCSEIKRGPRQRHHKEKAEEDDQVCSFDVLFFKQKKKTNIFFSDVMSFQSSTYTYTHRQSRLTHFRNLVETQI